MKQANLRTNILLLRICIISFLAAILSLFVYTLSSPGKSHESEGKEQVKTGELRVQGKPEIQYTPSFIII